MPIHPARHGRGPLWAAPCLFLSALLAPVTLTGQVGEGFPSEGNGDVMEQEAAAPAGAPSAQATRTDEPIQVDGRLDEPIWSHAPVIDRFTQIEPIEGAPASERTEVRIVYDTEAVYVGAMLYDSGPLTTFLARRDASMNESDAFIVFFDSYLDRQTAYRFATNPSGMVHDQIVMSGRNDSSWDPVWDVATHVTEEGWSVEMRIPFSQLRFRPQDIQTWGLQLERRIHRNQEEAVFAFTPRLEQSGVHRFGLLEGIQGIESGRGLEILPYMVARAEYVQGLDDPAVDFGNPYRSGSDFFANVGADLKYSVSSNLTLDATVNPDFGQVEMDPAVINLTAFETRFDERRPFFVEGQDIFRFSEGGPRGSVGAMPQLLYSRRIGRSPQGSAPSSAVFADEPSSTTILGAAKLTGRIGDGWSIGVMDAVTAEEEARFVDTEGVRDRTVVEPRTNYFVGRVRRDGRDGDTRIGSIFTAVNRETAGSGLEGRLHSSAYVGGVDLVHQWDSQTWRFNSSVSWSHVTGDPAAITRTQRASQRYYQRPDAGHVELDGAATSLSGYFAMGLIEKQSGVWTGRLGLGVSSPGYELNDLGFQTASDRIYFDTHLQYNQTRPGRYLRNWAVFGGPNGVWNYDGDQVLDNTNVMARWQLMNYWGGSLRLAYMRETRNDRLTRGGPLALDPAAWEANLSLSTDSRRWYTVRGNVRTEGDAGGSWNRVTGLTLNLKPQESWEVEVGPQLRRSRTTAQYVTTVEDHLATSTYGHRYVFATLDQTTFGIESRVNVTFSPALSLQLYTQPFLSSGNYGTLKELAAPRTFEFLRYGEDKGTLTRQEDGRYLVEPSGPGTDNAFVVNDPDFNLRSLIGNAVLRWEWRPGSTLYLVWQQRRAETVRGVDREPGFDPVGDFALGRESRELFRLQPDNIFAIKVNYWLSP